ncbi:MAG TPA: hypothetical protein VL131_08160 [Gammaproteobacteria bacterium]|nr:hypothetical protein [Gammaproteobacteria bacterium]
MGKLTRALVFAALTGVASLALGADAGGTWTASFDTQVGKQSYTYVFQVKGATLTGTAKGNLITDSVLSDGKVDGNKISFVEKGSYMGMALTFNYTGELKGDEIHFKRELMGFPAEEFDAKRSK